MGRNNLTQGWNQWNREKQISSKGSRKEKLSSLRTSNIGKPLAKLTKRGEKEDKISKLKMKRGHQGQQT